MEIYLHNTLTKKKDLFEPIEAGKVSMYHCGLTVYNYAHIGNLRAFVFADILRRMFEFNEYKVKQVINITDIGELSSEGEDKMVKGLKREGKPITMEAMKEMADFYTEAFKKDLQLLNTKTPHFFPKASDYVSMQILFIEKLETKGYAYRTSDGVYFDTSKFSEYGKLGGIDAVDVTEQIGRIHGNAEKKNPRDFALWKLNPELGFESAYGKGFPGWHLECSTMAIDLLGETFDIHTGGVDHIAIHHNNEIAQSEACTGKTFVHYWLHENFISINDEKISKSLQNELYLSELTERNANPLSYRYFLLSAHYRTLVNFSFEALEASAQALQNLYDFFIRLGNTADVSEIYEEYLHKFLAAINDDLNTSKALSVVWELVKDPAISASNKKATLLKFDEVLGLGLSALKPLQTSTYSIVVDGKAVSIISERESIIPKEILNLIATREEARIAKDWTKADEIRDSLNQQGYNIVNSEHDIIVR